MLEKLESENLPVVSIVIAAYNAMTYLPKTLSSVFHQTFQNYEVIIVDDGSIDDIRSWAASLTDDRVVFISQANAGSAAARNTGIARARGKYIAFLDADDLWAESKLEEQVAMLEQQPETGVVYSWVAAIDETDASQGKVIQNSYSGDVLADLIEHDILECGSNPMIRKACFETTGVFDPRLRYAQTWDMWLRLAKEFPFHCIKKPLTFYRFHANNTSKKWENMEYCLNLIVQKTFSNISPDLKHLEGRSYAFVNLHVAWKMLQNRSQGGSHAFRTWLKAVRYYPKIVFSKESIRFITAFLIVQFFGLGNYNRFRDMLYLLKKGIKKSSSAQEITT